MIVLAIPIGYVAFGLIVIIWNYVIKPKKSLKEGYEDFRNDAINNH